MPYGPPCPEATTAAVWPAPSLSSSAAAAPRSIRTAPAAAPADAASSCPAPPPCASGARAHCSGCTGVVPVPICTRGVAHGAAHPSADRPNGPTASTAPINSSPRPSQLAKKPDLTAGLDHHPPLLPLGAVYAHCRQRANRQRRRYQCAPYHVPRTSTSRNAPATSSSVHKKSTGTVTNVHAPCGKAPPARPSPGGFAAAPRTGWPSRAEGAPALPPLGRASTHEAHAPPGRAPRTGPQPHQP